MGVWSKVLPLTASRLSPLRACPDDRVVYRDITDRELTLTTARLRIAGRACENVASDIFPAGLEIHLHKHSMDKDSIKEGKRKNILQRTGTNGKYAAMKEAIESISFWHEQRTQ